MEFRLCWQSRKSLRDRAGTLGGTSLSAAMFVIYAHHKGFARCDIVAFAFKCIDRKGYHVSLKTADTGRLLWVRWK